MDKIDAALIVTVFNAIGIGVCYWILGSTRSLMAEWLRIHGGE